MTRESIIESIKNTLKRYGITKAYLFGSFARLDDDYHDIDVAIEPPQGKFSLFDLVGVEQELEDLTGQKVDVVIYRALKTRIRSYVDQDLVPIL
jgi:uncharacterized protein